MIIGFDTDSTITGRVLDEAYAKSARFIMLYLKHATPTLVALIHSKKFAIGLIWETSARRALSGQAGGLADARSAVLKVRMIGNVPASVAIFTTVDFDATVQQQPTVLAYLSGFRAGLLNAFKTGCYANGAICQAALDAKIVDYAWLAGGLGMRGSRAFLETTSDSLDQDVGDKRRLGLPIAVDTDVANDDLPWAWRA